MSTAHFDIEFVRSGRGKAQCPPDPAFPDGVAVDMSRPGRPHCDLELPYPAPECGRWHVRCRQCFLVIAITAAGRPDDPRHLRIACLSGAKN
jgi:hypothetical protein